MPASFTTTSPAPPPAAGVDDQDEERSAAATHRHDDGSVCEIAGDSQPPAVVAATSAASTTKPKRRRSDVDNDNDNDSHTIPAAAAASTVTTSTSALLHVLTNVLELPPDAVVVVEAREGNLRSVSDLCHTTLEELIRLTPGSGAGPPPASSAFVAAPSPSSPGSVSEWAEALEKVLWLRMWHAHLHLQTRAVPTDEQWLAMTSRDWDAFKAAVRVREQPADGAEAAEIAGAEVATTITTTTTCTSLSEPGGSLVALHGRRQPSNGTRELDELLVLMLDSLRRAGAEEEQVGRPWSSSSPSSSLSTVRILVQQLPQVLWARIRPALTGPTAPPGHLPPVPAHGRMRYLQLAREFVNSILNQEPVPIEGSGGMFVMTNVVSIEAGRARPVIVFPRRLRQFWKACLDTVDAHDVDPRKPRCNVVAVGSSGVGKTKCTPYLIKMLLERKKTVVYRVRHVDKDETVYEFIPGRGHGADAVAANVYPADRIRMGDIPSLSDPNTYYIVDPSKYKGSCDMDSCFRPKVIIVAEPDERLLGASQFFKARGGVYGELKYFPLWELDELLHALPFLSPEMSDEQVRDRYLQVGGIPGHVFRPEDSFRHLLNRQTMALNVLSLDPDQFARLANPQTLPVLDDSRPANALIGYDVDPSDDGTFSNYVVQIVATRAVARAFTDAMRQAWPSMAREATREAEPVQRRRSARLASYVGGILAPRNDSEPRASNR